MPTIAMDPVWNLFFDQNSVKYLLNAELPSGKGRNSFPYPYQIKSEMNIKYYHNGGIAWSAPTGSDYTLLFLVSRNDDDTYNIWKLSDQEQIKNATSDAGKISAGYLKKVGLSSDEPTYKANNLQAAQEWIYGESK